MHFCCYFIEISMTEWNFCEFDDDMNDKLVLLIFKKINKWEICAKLTPMTQLYTKAVIDPSRRPWVSP